MQRMGYPFSIVGFTSLKPALVRAFAFLHPRTRRFLALAASTNRRRGPMAAYVTAMPATTGIFPLRRSAVPFGEAAPAVPLLFAPSKRDMGVSAVALLSVTLTHAGRTTPSGDRAGNYSEDRMQITEAQLAQICQSANKYTIARFAPRLTRACAEFYIDTPRRVAAFLSQLAHEAGEFRWLREIWGPTPQQKRYEPPGKLSERLGNTEPGDGKRFLGRGLIQLTGRANYRDCSKALFPDDPELLLHRPELLEQPTQACRSAAWFWWSRGLNRYADSNDYTTLTKRINGGTNGLDQRVKYWRRALSAFHVNETVPTGGAGDD